MKTSLKPDDIFTRDELKVVAQDSRYQAETKRWHSAKDEASRISVEADEALWAVRDQIVAELRARKVSA